MSGLNRMQSDWLVKPNESSFSGYIRSDVNVSLRSKVHSPHENIWGFVPTIKKRNLCIAVPMAEEGQRYYFNVNKRQRATTLEVQVFFSSSIGVN